MIAYLSGVIQSVEDTSIVVLVGGVGYQVFVPRRLLETVHAAQDVELYTYQHVREEQLDLFGFDQREEVTFFKQLIQVSGVGPRLALAVLSHFPADDVKRAIIHGDIAFLSSVPGVGKKTAERIILDLKESIALNPGAAAQVVPHASGMNAVDALLSLGYSKAEAVAAIQGVDSSLSLEQQVRAALKMISQPSR